MFFKKNSFLQSSVGKCLKSREEFLRYLPVRFGGLGILNPVETADVEYEASMKITASLKQLIYYQQQSLEHYNEDQVKELINKNKQDKGKRLTQEFEQIKSQVDDNLKRYLDLAREKGSGSWLNALPLEQMGYDLNKQDFRDSICIRYGWRVPRTPQFCSCGKTFDTNHALICTKGGYVIMRHNRIRDLEATILKDVCKDVKVEPDLIPIGNSTINSTNTTEGARLDVSAVGIWSPMERTFLDVRVVHPNSPSYMNIKPEKLYEQHEKDKKRTYNHRITQVEKASFTPLVFSTLGGMGRECARYHKQVAQLIAIKTNQEYSHVMNHLRTRLRFVLLKSTVIAIRGERGKPGKARGKISDLSFNTIPDMPSYEV